jgi:hypothetical protein
MPLTNFFDNLQRNNLFTDKNPMPIQPPDFGQRFDPLTFLNYMRTNRGNYQEPVPFMPSSQPVKRPMTRDMTDPNSQPNVVFKPTGVPEQFVSNILNPPERGFKFQELKQKNDIANRGLDVKQNIADANNEIKYGDQAIKQQRADTGTFSAETRRRLASLHDLSDSEKIQMLQDGKVTLQELKDAATLKQIGARGEQNRMTGRERADQNINAIQERGDQARQTNYEKPNNNPGPSSNQQRIGQNNLARQLKQTDPELGKFIEVDPATGNFNIQQPSSGYFGRTSGPTLDQFSKIKQAIYGGGNDAGNNTDTSSSNTIDRNGAVEALKKAGLPVTEDNIKKAMDPTNYKK